MDSVKSEEFSYSVCINILSLEKEEEGNSLFLVLSLLILKSVIIFLIKKRRPERRLAGGEKERLHVSSRSERSKVATAKCMSNICSFTLRMNYNLQFYNVCRLGGVGCCFCARDL